MLEHKLESIGSMQEYLVGHREGNRPSSLKGLEPGTGTKRSLVSCALVSPPLSADQLALPLCVQGRNGHASPDST